MIKTFLALATFVFISHAASAQVTDPAKRKELSSIFFQDCIKNTETKPGDATYVYMKKFCECSASSVMDNFTEAKLSEMDGWSEEQMTNVLMPVIQECMTTLEAELTKFYKAEEK